MYAHLLYLQQGSLGTGTDLFVIVEQRPVYVEN